MNLNVNQLLEGAQPYNRQLKEETKGLIDKWEKSGLLEGLDGYDRNGVAILLENQAKQLISEANITGGTENWEGVALPLVRKVFSEIAAKDFVSVQPMNLPSGLIFWLDFAYGTDGPVSKYSDGTSVYGNTSSSVEPDNDGFYGAGRFGYGLNDQSISATAFTIATASWADLNFDAGLSASFVAGESDSAFLKVAVAASAFTRPDLEGVRGFHIVDADVAAYYPHLTTVSDDENTIYFIVSQSTAGDIVEADTLDTIYYYQQPTETTRGDYEDVRNNDPNVSTEPVIHELDVEMKQQSIIAKSRKLKAVWSPEFAQDLNAYHAIDAEAELTSMLSEFISMEIDLEIVDMLMLNALTTEYWSAAIGYEINAAKTNFVSTATNASAYTKQTWYQTLLSKIQKVSNLIHQRTMRGGANFVIVSPTVATVLESIPGFAVNTNGDSWGTNSFAAGIEQMGTLQNRWNVYKNPYQQEDTILLGYRGTQFLETGAVYAPYIPLLTTPLVYDPNTFTPRKGVMTRYAKEIVRPEFYGKIIVGDSQSI